MEGVTYDGVTYDSRVKKWKLCKVNGLTDHPVEEIVTGLSLYYAIVELRWRRKYPPKGEGYVYYGVFPNREKIYKKEYITTAKNLPPKFF